MNEGRHFGNVILIGGSAGSLPIVMKLLTDMPASFSAVVVIILHRLKNVASDMDQLLSRIAGVAIEEPDDKTSMQRGRVYLAPANYHLLADEEDTLSLDYSEPELHSRPCINVSFASFAQMYGSRVTGILLSGSNNDGAEGLRSVSEHSGSASDTGPGGLRVSYNAGICCGYEPGSDTPYCNGDRPLV